MNQSRLNSFITEQNEKYMDKEISLFGEKVTISKLVFIHLRYETFKSVVNDTNGAGWYDIEDFMVSKEGLLKDTKIIHTMDCGAFCFDTIKHGILPIVISSFITPDDFHKDSLSYIDAYDLSQNKEPRYTDKEIRLTHNIEKLLLAGALDFKKYYKNKIDYYVSEILPTVEILNEPFHLVMISIKRHPYKQGAAWTPVTFIYAITPNSKDEIKSILKDIGENISYYLSDFNPNQLDEYNDLIIKMKAQEFCGTEHTIRNLIVENKKIIKPFYITLNTYKDISEDILRFNELYKIKKYCDYVFEFEISPSLRDKRPELVFTLNVGKFYGESEGIFNMQFGSYKTVKRYL